VPWTSPSLRDRPRSTEHRHIKSHLPLRSIPQRSALRRYAGPVAAPPHRALDCLRGAYARFLRPLSRMILAYKPLIFLVVSVSFVIQIPLTSAFGGAKPVACRELASLISNFHDGMLRCIRQ